MIAPDPGSRRRCNTSAHPKIDIDAQVAAQSIREMFRQLASALHPDRERDPAQRQTKTTLMQKAHQAYAANDLLTLLELQSPDQRVAAGAHAAPSTLRLKHDNKLLCRQPAELQNQTSQLKANFCIDFELENTWGLSPGKLLGRIGEHSKYLQAELILYQRSARMLADRSATKPWLKLERQQARLRRSTSTWPDRPRGRAAYPTLPAALGRVTRGYSGDTPTHHA